MGDLTFPFFVVENAQQETFVPTIQTKLRLRSRGEREDSMKLKATVSDVLPGLSHGQRFAVAQLVITLNDPGLRRVVFDRVLVANLRVPSRDSGNPWGPAEAFTQECDRMVPSHPDTLGMDVTLSGVSVTARRAAVDFWNALATLGNVYEEMIRKYLPVGMKAQLGVRMGLDRQIEYLDRPGTTSLPEQPAVLVEGAGELTEEVPPAALLMAELRARLGIPTADLLVEVLGINHRAP